MLVSLMLQIEELASWRLTFTFIAGHNIDKHNVYSNEHIPKGPDLLMSLANNHIEGGHPLKVGFEAVITSSTNWLEFQNSVTIAICI